MSFGINVMAKHFLRSLYVTFQGIEMIGYALYIIEIIRRIKTEIAPAVNPCAVLHLLVTRFKGVHYLLCFIALGKIHLVGKLGDGIELDFRMLANIFYLYENSIVPDVIKERFAKEIEITLTLNDMCAFKIFITADAVGMLKQHHVRSVIHHLVSHLNDSRRGVTAVFLTAVINNCYVIGIFLCLSYIVHRKVRIVGIAAASVGQRV